MLKLALDVHLHGYVMATGSSRLNESARGCQPAKVENWDYWGNADGGGGKTAKEFAFAELNSDTGWFQIWRGRKLFS